jgi:hypothetical protein
MDTFARVELHEGYAGDKPDYELLHTAMSAAGFARYFIVGLKKKFLPTGMYHSSSANSLPDVLTAVERAAAKTGHTSEGVITRGDLTLTWGLKEEPLRFPAFSAMLSPAPPPLGIPLRQAGRTGLSKFLMPDSNSDANWERIPGLFGTPKK